MADSLGPGGRNDPDIGTAVQTEPLEGEEQETAEETLCLRVLFDLGKPYARDLGTGVVLALKPRTEPFFLGRDTRGNDGTVLIQDRSVSRRHIEVWVSEDGHSIQLRTLDAKNDTYVDGELVHGSCILNKGAILRIGGTLLLVSSPRSVQQRSGGDVSRMLGSSPELQNVRWLVSQRADSSTPVMIWGESGVGKELVAEALHNQSRRRAKPFIRVNCATLSPSLAASELSGHQKGAFTGATQTTKGLFGEATEGTLFLDEIHWLATDVQGQLLRVLDHGKVRSTGGTGEQGYDVRIVAASNQDLRELSDKSTPPFLADLRARLGDWYRIHIPPLRERREDILPIFVGLLEKEAALRDRQWLLDLKLSWRLADELLRRPWLNNVRDLRTVAQALVDLTPTTAKFLSLDPIEEFLSVLADDDPVSSSSSTDLPVKTRRKKSQ